MNEVFQRLDELSDVELATLVAAAEHVIAGDDEDAAELAAMPSSMAGAAIADELSEVGTPASPEAVSAVLRDRSVVLAALHTIAAEPPVADAVADVYRKRRDMLAVDGGLLTGAALLLFVLKLKRVKIGKIDVSFYDARQGVLEQLRTLLGR
jgi:hypothetical protein